MKQFTIGFTAAYLVATVYWSALLSATGAITPAGAAPIAGLMWPVTLAPVFWLAPKPAAKREVSP